MPTAKKMLATSIASVAPTNPFSGLAKVSFSVAFLAATLRAYGDVTSVRLRVTRDEKVVFTSKSRQSTAELLPGRYHARLSVYRPHLPVTYFGYDFTVRAAKAPALPAGGPTTTVRQTVVLPASQSGLIRPLAGAVAVKKVAVKKAAAKKAVSKKAKK